MAGIFASGKFRLRIFPRFRTRMRRVSLVKPRIRWRRFRQLSVRNFPFIKRNLETSSFLPTCCQLAFASTRRNYETTTFSTSVLKNSFFLSLSPFFPSSMIPRVLQIPKLYVNTNNRKIKNYRPNKANSSNKTRNKIYSREHAELTQFVKLESKLDRVSLATTRRET